MIAALAAASLAVVGAGVANFMFDTTSEPSSYFNQIRIAAVFVGVVLESAGLIVCWMVAGTAIADLVLRGLAWVCTAMPPFGAISLAGLCAYYELIVIQGGFHCPEECMASWHGKTGLVIGTALGVVFAGCCAAVLFRYLSDNKRARHVFAAIWWFAATTDDMATIIRRLADSTYA